MAKLTYAIASGSWAEVDETTNAGDTGDNTEGKAKRLTLKLAASLSSLLKTTKPPNHQGLKSRRLIVPSRRSNGIT
jgi:hypothetical protein